MPKVPNRLAEIRTSFENHEAKSSTGQIPHVTKQIRSASGP